MSKEKTVQTKKSNLHPRNKHQGRYDFKELVKLHPDLKPYLQPNKHGNESIDFHNPAAVTALNQALLRSHFGIYYWEVPEGYLIPPVPGRADYIHYTADLISGENRDPKRPVRCLDIGTGASLIYPIIGVRAYNWQFVATESNEASVLSAQNILDNNKTIREHIELRKQQDRKDIFKGIIKEREYFDLTICNPPFHASAEEAAAGNIRKLKNLKKQKTNKTKLNFGGKNNELWCEGGEKAFVKKMIHESKRYGKQCRWFTCLISKKNHLQRHYDTLKSAHAKEVKTIETGQGNKVSRILAWRFY